VLPNVEEGLWWVIFFYERERQCQKKQAMAIKSHQRDNESTVYYWIRQSNQGDGSVGR
jgi:hypothetical protein